MGTMKLRNEKEMRSFLDKFSKGTLKETKASVFKQDIYTFFDIIESYHNVEYSLTYNPEALTYIVTLEKN